jgi:hypothetical protein
MYKKKNAKATAGKTRPVKGTKIEGKNVEYAKIEGKNAVDIANIPVQSHYNSR